MLPVGSLIIQITGLSAIAHASVGMMAGSDEQYWLHKILALHYANEISVANSQKKERRDYLQYLKGTKMNEKADLFIACF